MEEWKKYKLQEIVDINPTESLKKGTVAKKIGMDILQPYTRAIPSYTLEPFSGGTKFRNGDTIMARITPCLENGKTAMVNILDKDEIGFGSTEYIVFRAKEGITDPFFIYYLVASSEIREPAIKSMVGSSGRQRVQTDVVSNLSIKLPSLPTQQKIAAILSSLDDKIELNNKINENLEQQAQEIYKNICQNAETRKFEDLISSIETGTRPKGGAELSGIPSIGAEKIEGLGKYDYSNEKYISLEFFSKMKRGIVLSKDVLLYKDGAYTGKSSMALNGFPHKECAVNEHVFILRTKDNYAQFFLYCTLKNPDIHKSIYNLACGKAAQPGLNQQELLTVNIPLLAKENIEKFEETVSPLMNNIAENALENRNLATIRDTLLPKLMNGEIEV